MMPRPRVAALAYAAIGSMYMLAGHRWLGTDNAALYSGLCYVLLTTLALHALLRRTQPPAAPGPTAAAAAPASSAVDPQLQDYALRLQHATDAAVQAISVMVELRDPYTSGHERRVADLAAAIARQMGLSDTQVTGVRIAGSVHDVGKITVPAEILAKPGRLSAAEYEIIKTHPEKGHAILRSISFPWPVAEAVLQHHERLDGSGYPQGLRAAAITTEARVLAVADVVESMASHRPYRAALGIEAALAEIEQHAGVLYDAAVVAACVHLFRELHYQLPQ